LHDLVSSFCWNLRNGNGVRGSSDAGEGLSGDRVRPEYLSADVIVSGQEENRSDVPVRCGTRYARAGPCCDRQCDIPWKPGGRMRARTQTAILFAARVAERILHTWQTFAGRRWHTWQDHHHIAPELGFRT